MLHIHCHLWKLSWCSRAYFVIFAVLVGSSSMVDLMVACWSERASISGQSCLDAPLHKSGENLLAIGRSGQVRSECLTCTFRVAVVAHTCHRYRYQPSPVPLSGTGKKKGEGVRGDHLHWRV